MKKMFSNIARCPECGSTDLRVTPFGLYCDSCGEIVIPDGWLDETMDVARRVCSSVKRSTRKRHKKPQGGVALLDKAMTLLKKKGKTGFIPVSWQDIPRILKDVLIFF